MKTVYKTIAVLLIVSFVMPLISFADMSDYTYYGEIDDVNYTDKFDESTLTAVMKPVSWGGDEEEYLRRDVFSDIDYKSIDIIKKNTLNDEDALGDVILIELENAGRENVIEANEALKENKYVIYSTPNYTEDEDEEEATDTVKYTDCFYTDGFFSVDSDYEGMKITALYKDGLLIDCAVDKDIFIYNRDYDSISVFIWDNFESICPATEKLDFLKSEIPLLPSRSVKEPRYGDIPAVSLTGDMTQISKDNPVTLHMEYTSATDSFEGYLTAKWQGNAALNYDKKNFSIKMYKDEACEDKLKRRFKDWDKSYNYVLKANWVDSTAARNIVCARLYETLPNAQLPNGSTGVVDGFPIRLYINGEYQGLYTWNKPKRGWIFGMKDEKENELLYFAFYQSGSCLFKKRYSESRYWNLMYPDTHYSAEEFDRVTGFVAYGSDEDFKNHVTEYFDMDSLLNYYVFSQIITNHDGTGKNMNMATFDGRLWYIRPYDMDATFGIEWYGWKLKPYNFDMCTENFDLSELWTKLQNNFPQEIYDRYVLLRNNQLSKEKILEAFRYFMTSVGDDLYAEDLAVWPKQPSRNYRYNQIVEYLDARYPYLDEYMQRFNVEGK